MRARVRGHTQHIVETNVEGKEARPSGVQQPRKCPRIRVVEDKDRKERVDFTAQDDEDDTDEAWPEDLSLKIAEGRVVQNAVEWNPCSSLGLQDPHVAYQEEPI